MKNSNSNQNQFLQVIDRDSAEKFFRAAIDIQPAGEEHVPLSAALGRVLSRDVISPVDVPSFDRSNFDGYAVRAEDTYGASEEEPVQLRLVGEEIATAVIPQTTVQTSQAMSIATGGMIPRGADAVVLIEHARIENGILFVSKSVTPSFGVSFAGTDISIGETVARVGTQLSSRETGVLAAVGVEQVRVWTKPTVAIISTGNELIAPGAPMQPGLIYDSNATILSDAVTEAGGIPVNLGIVTDDLESLRRIFVEARKQADIVVLSGGTSKGAGDLSYHVVRELDDPGIVAHGVALKPGKPICLASSQGQPIVILPGFPTSAVFTFHEFVAPVIRQKAGLPPEAKTKVSAPLALKVNSEIGRTEYLLVGLVRGKADGQFSAFPMGKGSGSVTSFSHADGFVTIDRHTEIVDQNEIVDVQIIGNSNRLADLIVTGSHCVGLDYLLGEMQRRGFRTKFLAVGSTAGLAAIKRGECDLAGCHLYDENLGIYNAPFLSPAQHLIKGYRRKQGILFRADDFRFEGKDLEEILALIKTNSDCFMINRNQGSGTRVLIDNLLGESRPTGYAIQAKNHSAVGNAIAQFRADWGVAIESIARELQLGFLEITDEEYDFVVPVHSLDHPSVVAFQELLGEQDTIAQLRRLGLSR